LFKQMHIDPSRPIPRPVTLSESYGSQVELSAPLGLL
jgi:hypothetical protein